MHPDKVETNPKFLISYRKNLRSYGTPAEATLWILLKNKKIENTRFRRQFAIGKYILDFYAPELKLSIELDGGIHADPQIVDHDFHRREFLKTQGVTELRFKNDEVHYKIHEVIDTIKFTIQELRRR